jgi:hypothetical protein
VSHPTETPTFSAPSVRIDPSVTATDLLTYLYAGDIVVLTKLDAVKRLVTHASDSLRRLFHGHDPEFIHQTLSPSEVADLLVDWKPTFIHHPTTVALANLIAIEAGFDADQTYSDVPKPRTAFPQGHLTHGIAGGFPWHRDTWYAAPEAQINWWMPIFHPEANNAMAFDLSGFGAKVANNSNHFDYYERNQDRHRMAELSKSDTRIQPGAADWHANAPLVLLPDPGSILLFAGAHLHRTIPNTSKKSRYSVDFRTIHAPDVLAGRGAPCIDNLSTGTAIRDFKRVSDRSPVPDEIVLSLEPGGPPLGALLEFSPTQGDN